MSVLKYNSIIEVFGFQGGKEHGVPILISDLEPELSKKNLFVGDAILSVNGIDLNQVSWAQIFIPTIFEHINMLFKTESLLKISPQQMEDYLKLWIQTVRKSVKETRENEVPIWFDITISKKIYNSTF